MSWAALDHFIVFGEQHFDHLVSQYVEHSTLRDRIRRRGTCR